MVLIYPRKSLMRSLLFYFISEETEVWRDEECDRHRPASNLELPPRPPHSLSSSHTSPCSPAPGHWHRWLPVPGLLCSPFFTCFTPPDLHASTDSLPRSLLWPFARPNHPIKILLLSGLPRPPRDLLKLQFNKRATVCWLPAVRVCVRFKMAANCLTFCSRRGGVSSPLKLGWSYALV